MTSLITRGLLVALVALVLPAAASAAPPNVTPDPVSVDFGQQSVNIGTNSVEIKFQNLSGADIDVFGFSIGGVDPSQFQTSSDGCYGQTLPDGNYCSVYMFFQPDSLGNFSALADLNTDEGTESVPLTGEGAAGSLSGTAPTYNPQPYFFGNQYGNAQFKNTDPNLTVQSSNATITGPDAAFFSIGYNGCDGQTLYPGNTCGVDVYFNPTGPGTKNAQLNLFNSGSPNPATVPLSATALAGPDAVVTPETIDFGNVGIGSSSAATHVTIDNQGDFVLQIQQVFVISGAPNFFPLTDNQCSGALIPPGSSCGFDVSFAPGTNGTGPQNGSLFVITNSPGPITQSFMSGTGYEFPEGGTASISGEARALNTISCDAGGFPAGTDFSYGWYQGGNKIASGRNYRVSDSDIGKRLKCIVTASNPVGSSQAESPKTEPVAPASLVRMPGGLVAASLCRAVQAPGTIGGATVNYGRPVSPAAPIRIDGRGMTTVKIDGVSVGRSSTTVEIPPRSLSRFGDGGHVLSVSGGGSSGQAGIALSGCTLAARGFIRWGRATIKASSSVGMGPMSFEARRQTRFRARRLTGRITFKALRMPSETFLVTGRHSGSNGVSVTATRKTIKVQGLPPNTGVVRLSLTRRSFSGNRFGVGATLKTLGRQTINFRAGRQN